MKRCLRAFLTIEGRPVLSQALLFAVVFVVGLLLPWRVAVAQCAGLPSGGPGNSVSCNCFIGLCGLTLNDCCQVELCAGAGIKGCSNSYNSFCVSSNWNCESVLSSCWGCPKC
jgi:hypothetical protein